MNRSMHKKWGDKGMLFYCPHNKVVWEYDRNRKVYIHEDMPTYGLNRRKLPNG
jgi:hypothetical protein